MLDQALEKLEAGRKGTKGMGRAAQIMAGPVADALAEFCRQDGEFAQAVVQGGGFADCMKAVAKNCAPAISDLEAYRRAVQYYFPGAEIHMHMTIDLIGQSGNHTPTVGGGIVLDLTDFL